MMVWDGGVLENGEGTCSAGALLSQLVRRMWQACIAIHEECAAFVMGL
jgi:hypothetical protein